MDSLGSGIGIPSRWWKKGTFNEEKGLQMTVWDILAIFSFDISDIFNGARLPETNKGGPEMAFRVRIRRDLSMVAILNSRRPYSGEIRRVLKSFDVEPLLTPQIGVN